MIRADAFARVTRVRLKHVVLYGIIALFFMPYVQGMDSQPDPAYRSYSSPLRRKLDQSGYHNSGNLLIQAVQSKQSTLVATLLNKGVDANSVDNHGSNALIYAVFNCDIETISILMQYGADPYIKNQIGESASSIAKLRFSWLRFYLEFSPSQR